MRVEKIVLNEDRNVTLTAYLQEVGGAFRYVTRRPAVLILPGGGYQYCSDREADPVAMPYLKAGYQAFILRYSVNTFSAWPNPLEDYEQAMELIRSKEEEWSLYGDKIAVIGFSAGGHLAASAATMAKNRPNAAILGYAVAGSDVKGCNISAPDTIPAVDKDTCPCFIFATRTDNVVPITNSIQFMQALADHGIAFESHIYAYGPHGFSTCDTSIQSRDTEICERVPNWVGDSIGWLRDVFGDFGDGCMTTPACKDHVNGNHEAFLSVECTVGHLKGKEKAWNFLEPLIEEMYQQAETQNEGNIISLDEMKVFIEKMRLCDVLEYANAPGNVKEQLNDTLTKIPNE